jgi:hypothetical protein
MVFLRVGPSALLASFLGVRQVPPYCVLLSTILARSSTVGWDADDLMTNSRLGTLARCSSILADYEAVRRRSRSHPEEAGAQTGGQDRGNCYYMNLAIYVANYAKGAYEDFDGEPDLLVDAAGLTTIHKPRAWNGRRCSCPR